jgi:CheY-like chemotaxis protein
LARVVRKLGHHVIEATDGEEAIAAARLNRPEIILMDIGMPRMNGYEAAREIRREPWGSEVVLVATTGWGQEQDRQKSVAAGFDPHLVKPVELAALESILRPKNDLQVA